MDMSGERRIADSRKTVWAALNDAGILKQCIPGCETLQKQSPTEGGAVDGASTLMRYDVKANVAWLTA
jgi:carbon monoxide dehydrogenase subunit G